MSKSGLIFLLFLVAVFGFGLLAFYSPAEVSKAEFERLKLQVTQLQSELDLAYAKIERAEAEAVMWQEAAEAAQGENEKLRAKTEGINAWAIPLAAAAEVLMYLILLVVAVWVGIVGVRYCFAVARRFEASQNLPKKQKSPVPYDPKKFKNRGEWMRANRPEFFQKK